MLPRLRSIPMRERVPWISVGCGELDVLDGAFVVVDTNGVRTQIPVGGIACVFLEPGSRLSHRAAELAARVGTLLLWTGEGGVRLYSAGQPGGARADRLLHQARLALDPTSRIRVVRKMYAIRFGQEAPSRRSLDQLRGIEGVRVREHYLLLARQHGVPWKGRRYDPHDWDSADIPNRCLSAGTAALHGITEAAVLAAGYAPAIGFLHVGKPRSFVYDIADLVKMETVVPVAFRIAARAPTHPEREVRLACRDLFRESRLLARLIPLIEKVLAAGGDPGPVPSEGTVGPAYPDPPELGDAGHRH